MAEELVSCAAVLWLKRGKILPGSSTDLCCHLAKEMEEAKQTQNCSVGSNGSWGKT